MLFNFDFRRLDIYRKIPKDLTQPTATGAVISIMCMAFMFLLFSSELLHFMSGEVVSELYVDNPGKSTEKIPVFIKITLPKLKCEYIGLDIQDEMGRHEVGFVENTVKTPVGETGCVFEANFYINKVPGNFHVSTHSASEQPKEIDFSHIIQEVRFGENMDNKKLPGSFNSLKDSKNLENNGLESHDYIMKIVPTVYEDLGGRQALSYQYTYATRSYVSFGHGGRVIPAVWFRYDLTPITVKYHEKRPPIYSFLTTICAIIGGTFTVAGIIDSFVFTASEIFKKFELGKLS
ncbi:UNVERIFIED_CONTAM: hypothetical protein GTU68_009411 [Idotea baltica]|nr:hypothetical protein [Idotea baltica]